MPPTTELTLCLDKISFHSMVNLKKQFIIPLMPIKKVKLKEQLSKVSMLALSSYIGAYIFFFQ